MKRKTRWALLLALLCVLALAACGNGDTKEPEVTTLIYAKLSSDGVDRELLDKFNRSHKDVQIEVRDYTQLSEGGRQGVDLLMTEIAAGKIPDIIELGTSGETTEVSYRQFAEKGYLENLWPYIESDPDLGRDAVMEAPLKAAEINGGLYTLFESVRLHTLIGAESVVGDRTGWTTEDLMDAFASMPEEAVILDNFLDYPSMKDHLLSSIVYGFGDMFMDSETGECLFDSEPFRSVLQLASYMPAVYEWREKCSTYNEARVEHIRRIIEGEVMLEDIGFGSLEHLTDYSRYFGQVVLVGYPLGEGVTGSYFRPLGIKLAMSSTCQDKEAAWQYIRQLILPQKSNYQYEGLPINSDSYERLRTSARQGEHYTDINGQLIELDKLSNEDCQKIDTLYENTTRSSILLDKEVLDVVLEVCGPYLAGDRTLDDTVQMLNNRVGLYLNEQR